MKHKKVLLFFFVLVCIFVIGIYSALNKKTMIGETYAKSHLAVYLYHPAQSLPGYYEKVPGADVESFTELNLKGPYGRDKHGMYYYLSRMVGADSNTFIIVSDGYGHSYGRDAQSIYIDGKPIPDADIHTWEDLLRCSYSKDARYVFFETEIVQGADPATFIIQENCLGTDHLHVFWTTRMVEEVDPLGFEYISDEYFRNKNNVYYKKQVFAFYTLGEEGTPIVVLNDALLALFREYPNLRPNPERPDLGGGRVYGDGTSFYYHGEQVNVVADQ